MATANLGLETIDASDYVSPTPINNNMAKIDKLGVDYVIAQGKSGEWWYRKWKSGRAECGIDAKKFGQQQLGKPSPESTTYMTNRMSFGAYPFAFKSKPFVCISFEGDSELAIRGSFCVQQADQSPTTVAPLFAIVDWKAGTITPTCGIYATGSYK